MSFWFPPLLHRLLLLALLLLAGLAGCSDQPAADGPLTLYGNIDLREVQLAFQDGGRIEAIPVAEGAHITAGQVVARLDPTRFALEVRRLQAEVEAQQAQVDSLNAGSRPQEISVARAEVQATEAELNDAELTLERKKSLLTTIHISQQEVDNADARARAARARHTAAQQQLSLALEGPRQEDIHRASAVLEGLKASLDLARQRLIDCELRSPAPGILQDRILEPGALAAAGSPVMTLALDSPLWARAYVNGPDLGRIREGMRATIHTDSAPDRAFRGWVGFISPSAEFTPKTVETTELRTSLVYRTRIFVCETDHLLRLGMPVTVTLDGTMATDQEMDCKPQ
jgi:HlyD family secretion protein